MPTLTYEFYTNSYHGTLDEGGFMTSLVQAQALICSLVGEDVPLQHEDKWKYALCALCDYVVKEAGIQAESYGSTHVTYTQARASRTAYDVCAPYLASTGLLYRGV